MRDAAPDGRGFKDVGDVSEHDRYAFLHGDHGRAQVLDRLHATNGAHRPLGASLRHEPTGRVHIRVFNRMEHLVECHVSSRHACGIDLNLKLTQVSAQPLHRGDAGHGEEAVLDLELREIAERHEIHGAGLRLQRELQDLVQATGEARQQWRVGPGGQLRADLANALGDELPRPVVVRLGLELHGHLADA